MLPLYTQIVYHKQPRGKKTNRFAWTFNVDWRWREQTYGQLKIATYKRQTLTQTARTQRQDIYPDARANREENKNVYHSALRRTNSMCGWLLVALCSSQFTQIPNTGRILWAEIYMTEHKLYGISGQVHVHLWRFGGTQYMPNMSRTGRMGYIHCWCAEHFTMHLWATEECVSMVGWKYVRTYSHWRLWPVCIQLFWSAGTHAHTHQTHKHKRARERAHNSYIQYKSLYTYGPKSIQKTNEWYSKASSGALC